MENKGISRRQFVKYTTGGLAALVVGSDVAGILSNPAFAAVPALTLNFHITDAMKEMVTHNAVNDARCYFWVYKEDRFAADCPGPYIFAVKGSPIQISITNDLDEPHAFFIPGMFDSGPIAPGATVVKQFRPKKTGTFLYYDNLNEPVNRVMGLHGAFIVMPKFPKLGGHKFTPYKNPSKNVQRLFDDLGTTAHWPGLAWEEGDPATDTPPFRQYIWVLHQASSQLFAEVGNYTAGLDYPAADFVQKFLHDPFSPDSHSLPNNVPQYFTICGQSGHFAHNNPYICPNNRVGEPCVIRILNAGLMHHSTHIHANHVFVIANNGKVLENPLWVDTYTCNPLDTYDWLVPYMMPPDVPNNLGIGRQDLETMLPVIPTPIPQYGTGGGPTPAGVTTWPPLQELDFHIPKVGERIAFAQDGITPIDLGVHMSPLCFPMHDHSEPSQTAQGGNYNMGLISGLNFTGDRKGARPGGAGVITFDMAPPEHGPAFNLADRATTHPATEPFVAPSLP